MHRLILVSLFLACFSLVAGCSVGSQLFSKQEWSENYSIGEGVASTSPQMIDGNVRTVGETSFPPEASNFVGASPASQVVITLPEKRMIRRVVIHSDNLKTFDIFADKGGGDEETENWQLVKEVKSVKTNPIKLSIPIAFPTDKIRVRVLNTTDDSEVRRRERARSGGYNRFSGSRRAVAKIYEIELYGYKSRAETQEQEIVDQREQELDDLLK